MVSLIFTAAASSARAGGPISSTILKTPIARQPWQLATTSSAFFRNARLFSNATPTSFAASAVQKSSPPFRLSSDKHESTLPADEDIYSPYKPKRQWPPDMSKLSPKHQFRLERKYRRRAALKYARPKFVKTVTLAQWAIIGFVAIYAVLFMDWDTKDTPFDGIRESVFSGVRAVFSTPPPPGPVKRAETDGQGSLGDSK
ncbi:uncharacterized protein N7459_001473 [Penicillium hispanicum]|uniref:uncharacterized protein n=1 Tax=Penicillium hispanicum TaxID=1080232 RepID=UPI00253FE0ED|nr:uncharacterized protein N7459_001473 [Penicillium hispanicum]KAJ5595265.1 hypothetical protein N7459_001473 [Penicillium hispanicum]